MTEMLAELSIEFPKGISAAKALSVLGGTSETTRRAGVKRSVIKGILRISITADDFTALRALTTTSLRDMKVFLDAAKIANPVRTK